MRMTAKRFKFNGRTNCIEYDNKSILLDSYGEDIEELLNELYEENEQLKSELEPIKKICEKYRIPLKDLPEILEEYIAYDNDDEW